MPRGTCRSCEHFSANLAAKGNGVEGECRKNPPIAIAVPGRSGEPIIVGFFPPVQPSHWCGEHKAQINLES